MSVTGPSTLSGQAWPLGMVVLEFATAPRDALVISAPAAAAVLTSGDRGHPADLGVVHVMGLGNHEGLGVDHLTRAGLTRRFTGSHFFLSPVQRALSSSGEVASIRLRAGTSLTGPPPAPCAPLTRRSSPIRRWA